MIQSLLNERQKTHGNFADNAVVAQTIKSTYKDAVLPKMHREALDMIATKISRIVSGDFDHKDSWVDIAGYATLISNEYE